MKPPINIFLWLVLILVLVISFYIRAGKKGYQFGKDSVVQCKEGHFYTSIWIPAVSLKAARFGLKRFQKCPVGKNWSMTSLVRPEDITPEIAAQAARYHDIRIP